jgi:feruloyl-CoA synthase
MSAVLQASVANGIACVREPLAEGGFAIRCATPLAPYPESLAAVFRARALRQPDHMLFREVKPDGSLTEITYGQAFAVAQTIAANLRRLGAHAERPVALIAENAIPTALIILAAYLADVPVAPISPAYSKLSQDHGKLRHVLQLLRPSVVIFDDGVDHAAALARIARDGMRVVVVENPPVLALSWNDLASGPRDACDPPAHPGAVAKILFTSGSTGMPKGVVNTHRMMLSNQQALTQIWPFLSAPQFRLVDWLPWNHTFGGNMNFNMTLFHGGTLTIDRGKPTPSAIATTVRAIKLARPNAYFNVPRGLDVLAGALRHDGALREALFGELAVLGYAGAALPAPLFDELRAMARAVTGREVPIVGMWGSTETGPVATAVYGRSDHAGNIGLPVPGCALKFVPTDGKLEMRVRSPGVTERYWRQPELTADAFDADGYYRIGDAGRLLDPDDIYAGILFDGRLGENFKLTSGTWVNVGELRVRLIAACPDLIADAVIAGDGRDFAAALIFPKVEACQALCGAGSGESAASILRDARVRERIRSGLAAHNRSVGGSSHRIARALLLDEPPSVDGNEITDKGYLNQRAVLTRRRALVETLHADEPDPDVVAID